MLYIGTDRNETLLSERGLEEKRYITKNQKFGSTYSYDLLADKEMTQKLQYVHCSQPQRSKFAVA